MNDPIAFKRGQMPARYRGFYDRAMAGNSRLAAMTSFCLECVGWDKKEVALCTAPACPLYPYRPYRTGDEEVVIDVDDEVASDTPADPPPGGPHAPGIDSGEGGATTLPAEGGKG